MNPLIESENNLAKFKGNSEWELLIGNKEIDLSHLSEIEELRSPDWEAEVLKPEGGGKEKVFKDDFKTIFQPHDLKEAPEKA